MQWRALERRERPILLETRGQVLRALVADLVCGQAAGEEEGWHSDAGEGEHAQRDS